jgi:mono/diheme cytochrome c family protein
MRSFRLALGLVVASLTACAACAQAPNYSNLGRAPSKDEIQAWNQSIGPEGKELPPGSGTAKQGEEIFGSKCAACHGPAGEGSQLAP